MNNDAESINALQNERRSLNRRHTDYQIEHLQGIFASFETVGRHILLLNKQMRILYRSPYIGTQVAQHALPIELGSTFRLNEPRHAKRFQAFVDGLCRSNAQAIPATELHENLILPLERGEQSPLLLSCFPWPTSTEDDLKIIVILCDPACRSEQQWRAFQTLFGLTAAELRLCLSLTDGLTAADYSEKYRVTDNTVRSQLKAVFAKTNTRRQGDLLRLIFLLTRL